MLLTDLLRQVGKSWDFRGAFTEIERVEKVYYMMMVHKGRKASDKEAVKNADLADLDVEVSDQNIESEDDVEVIDQDVESVDILDVEVFHANLESEEDDGDIKLSVSGSI
ncbi:hypothetical protein DCAR_0626545 [Daucus carota subsp. sativus]|uniref:Uncharacterized protein n=1 Tax=Daucus carota subsp. sativus TaxID=79200 RepID=A0A164X4G3_DAUCS|nr:hypothetical protein DCAR_0626545 [Daucus carota subsp. sativus]